MTAMNVWRQLGKPPTVLCVVPNFADAPSIIERLAHLDMGFTTIYSARSRASAILSLSVHGITRTFLDSDVGLKIPFVMRSARAVRRKVRFSLYEEGVGIAKLSEAERPSRFLLALGATDELGESGLIEEVWTYSPEVVRKRLTTKPVLEIRVKLGDFVQTQTKLLTDAFWPSFASDSAVWYGTNCCLYLSSWTVNEDVYTYLAHQNAFTISKLHPHIREAANVPASIDQSLSSAIPAELIIAALVNAFETVTVLHHGSTTAMYVPHNRVTFVHVDSLDLGNTVDQGSR